MITIVHADARESRFYVGEGTVGVCMTSPPYKKKDGYSDQLMEIVAKDLAFQLAKNKLLFLNFGASAEDTNRVYKVRDIFAKHLDFVQEITWLKSFNGKGRFSSTQSPKFLNRMKEPVFVFSNGSNWVLDRLAVGVPYTCASNVKRFNHEQNLRCAGDVVYFPYDNKSHKDKYIRGHHYRFPPALAQYCLKLSGIKPGDGIVYDPFGGGGTLSFAAEEMQLDSTSVEITDEWSTFIREKATKENVPWQFQTLHCEDQVCVDD